MSTHSKFNCRYRLYLNAISLDPAAHCLPRSNRRICPLFMDATIYDKFIRCVKSLQAVGPPLCCSGSDICGWYNGGSRQSINSVGNEMPAMTGKATTLIQREGKLERFPDYPPRDDLQNWLHDGLLT